MKKKKILKFFVWSAMGMVTLVALLYAGIDWTGARAWKKIEAELRAKGEPMRLEEIIPPPIPDDQNFAYSPFFKGVFETEAIIENGRQIYRAKYPGAIQRINSLALPRNPVPPIFPNLKQDKPTDITAWQTYFRAHPEFRLPQAVGNPGDEIVFALGNWKVPLDEIAHDLRARPRMRAPLRYEAGFAREMPHIHGALCVSKLYQLRAIAYLRQSRSAEALEDLESLLLLSRAMEPGQTLFGSLVGAAMTKQALAILREGLAANAWNDAQLSDISLQLEKIDLLRELSTALRAERVVFLDATRRLFPSLLDTAIKTPGSPNLPQSPWWERMATWGVLHLPRGILELDRALYSRMVQDQLEKILDPDHGRIHVEAIQDFAKQMRRANAFPQRLVHVLTITAIPTFSSLKTGSAGTSASISEAKIAIALERYRLAQGSMPDNLTALVPTYLAQLPIDPIDGQPMRYRKDAETSYRIWSIGWEEKDSGGATGKKTIERDWVWKNLPPVSLMH